MGNNEGGRALLGEKGEGWMREGCTNETDLTSNVALFYKCFRKLSMDM